jgi:hypothetical protein
MSLWLSRELKRQWMVDTIFLCIGFHICRPVHRSVLTCSCRVQLSSTCLINLDHDGLHHSSISEIISLLNWRSSLEWKTFCSLINNMFSDRKKKTMHMLYFNRNKWWLNLIIICCCVWAAMPLNRDEVICKKKKSVPVLAELGQRSTS